MPRTSKFSIPPLLLLPAAALSPPLVLTIRAVKPQPSTAATTASAEVAPASNRTSADSLSSATSADSTPGRALQAADVKRTIERWEMAERVAWQAQGPCCEWRTLRQKLAVRRL
jgi:hypothetical protein